MTSHQVYQCCATLFLCIIVTNAMPGKLNYPGEAEYLNETRLHELHQHILPEHHIENMHVDRFTEKLVSRATRTGENQQIALGAQSPRNVLENSTFIDHLGGWIILGPWARYHLPYFNKTPPVPRIPGSKDQTVLISNISSFPATLSKTVPGLTNGNLTMRHYVDFKKNMSLIGTLVSGNITETIFNLTSVDLKKSKRKWVTSTFKLNPHLNNMTITISPRSNSTAVWAVSYIHLSGIEASPNSPEFLTTAKPTTIKQTTTVTNRTIIAPVINDTTTGRPANKTSVNSTATPIHQKEIQVNESKAHPEAIKEDPLKEIHGIATAIWDAFYVFLALFCACLIALVVMIFRQRCRNEESSPTMSTYNPRPSNYQLDQTRTNPAYQSDSV